MEEKNTSTAEEQSSRKWVRPALIITAIVVIIALCVGGGWMWWSHGATAKAQESCAQASQTLTSERKAYDKLLNGDVKTALQTKPADVLDGRTLTKLARDSKAKAPKTVQCPAKGRKAMNEATSRLTEGSSWYRAHMKTLKADVRAVDASRDAKTLKDAQGVYDSSDGKVQDESTRTALKAALDRKDAAKARDAAAKVQVSVKAKADADAKAAQQQAEQAAQQQAQLAQQQATPSYSGNSGYSGYTGGGYSGSYSAPSRPTPAPAQNSSPGYDPHWADHVGPPVCHAGDACGIG